jgi:hypothetical protein
MTLFHLFLTGNLKKMYTEKADITMTQCLHHVANHNSWYLQFYQQFRELANTYTCTHTQRHRYCNSSKQAPTLQITPLFWFSNRHGTKKRGIVNNIFVLYLLQFLWTYKQMHTSCWKCYTCLCNSCVLYLAWSIRHYSDWTTGYVTRELQLNFQPCRDFLLTAIFTLPLL